MDIAKKLRKGALLTGVVLLGISAAHGVRSQPSQPAKNRVQEKVVVVTGTRFSYPLIQKWIDDYNKENPHVEIIIEARGSSDPSQYDILAETYREENASSREHLYVAKYAILPVANSQSEFAAAYGEKGLDGDLITQLFFYDPFADEHSAPKIKAPYTVYTRLQKAGSPVTFAKHFGFQQQDVKGKAIAGSDEHLLKAVLRDPTAVSYLPLALIYDKSTRQPVQGLTAMPVDIDGNGRVNNDERIFGDLDQVIATLEQNASKVLKNIPIEYLHLSVSKENAHPRAVEFLRWVEANGQNYLHDFGYLLPGTEEERNQLASKEKK